MRSAGIDAKNGALGKIRTPDPQIRSLVLYPAELRAHSMTAGNAPVQGGRTIGEAGGAGKPFPGTCLTDKTGLSMAAEWLMSGGPVFLPAFRLGVL